MISASLCIVVRVYCSVCIRRLEGEAAERAVRDADQWMCYFCHPQDQTNGGLLSAREDWRDRVVRLFAPADVPQVSWLCNV